MTAYDADEMMTVQAARALRDGVVCFVGIGLPSAAANLARGTHAPNVVLIYESGCIGAKPGTLPLSIGDGILAETADAVVGVPEIFNYWLQPGRVDVGFLSGAQLDRHGDINTTLIGDDYRHPDIRLPGAGGAPEIASSCKEVVIVMRQTRRAFVDRLDFVTSRARPRVVITDLGVLEPDGDGELVLTHLHPGVDVTQAVEATGWPLRVAPSVGRTEPPTGAELATLRGLRP
jgi:glutaconate CoA-transferase subunit B